jgi:hypothetical protein
MFLFVAILGTFSLQDLHAQEAKPRPASTPASTLDFAVVYNGQWAAVNSTNRFAMQGASAQIHGKFWKGLGVVADVGETHTANMHNSGTGLDLVTATFGPRYTWQPPHRRLEVFGQFLGGEAWGLHSVFPAPGGAQSSVYGGAWQAGGGTNFRLNRYLSWRVFEADWLCTHLPNATSQSENNLRVGTGLILRLP